MHRLYTPQTGTRITELSQLENGKSYVASRKQRFKRMNYNGILNTRERENKYKNRANTRSLSPPKKRFEFAGRRDLDTLTGGSTGRAVYIIKNGDVHCNYTNLLLTKRNCLSWNSLCQVISDRMKMETAVRKIYTIGGEEVKDPSGFENGGTYVAVGRIRFKQVGYRPAPPLHATTPQRILPAISRPSPIKRKSPKKKQQVAPTPPPPKPPAAMPKPAPPPKKKKKPEPPKVRPQSYMISVQTMNEQGAGTTAQVSVTLYGSKGTSGAQLLNEDPDNFEAGAADTFAIECTPLGEVQRMRLEHDSSGPDSAWKVGRVSVRDAVQNKTSYFHCNRWLASDRGAFETVMELAATSDATPPTNNELLIAGATEDDLFSATAAAADDADIVDDSEETAVDVPVDMAGKASAVDEAEDAADDDDAGDEEVAEEADGRSSEEENAAATKIQAGFRGHKTRESLKKQHEEESAAATTIQAGFRGHKARESLKQQHEAATTIQAGFRGHQTRKSLTGQEASTAEEGVVAAEEEEGEVVGDEEEESAAAANDGGGEDADAAEGDSDEPTDAAKEAAVLEIQAAFYGRQAREEAAAATGTAAATSGDEEETKAATTIQASFRGHQTRKALKAKENAVLEIQAALLGYQARMAAETVVAFKSASGIAMTDVEAATIIQSRWRGYVGRRLMKEKEGAVLELQAAFQGHMARKEYAESLATQAEATAAEGGPEKPTEAAPSAAAAAEGDSDEPTEAAAAEGDSDEPAEAAAAEGDADEPADAAKEAAVLEIQAAFYGRQAREESAAAMEAAATSADEETTVEAEAEAEAVGDDADADADADANDGNDDDEALMMLEAAAEGHLVRTRAKEKMEAIQELQAHARGELTRKKLVKQKEHDITKSGAEEEENAEDGHAE